MNIDGKAYELHVKEMRGVQAVINTFLSDYHKHQYEVDYNETLLSVSLFVDEEPGTGIMGHVIDAVSIWTGEYWVPFETPEDWTEHIIFDVEQQMIDDSFCEPY